MVVDDGEEEDAPPELSKEEYDHMRNHVMDCNYIIFYVGLDDKR